LSVGSIRYMMCIIPRERVTECVCGCNREREREREAEEGVEQYDQMDKHFKIFGHLQL